MAFKSLTNVGAFRFSGLPGADVLSRFAGVIQKEFDNVYRYGGPGDASSVAWANIADKPATFAPSAHSHTIDEIIGLALDHGSLTGLSDDDHQQYLHLTNARSVDIQHTWTASQRFFTSPSTLTTYASNGAYIDSGIQQQWAGINITTLNAPGPGTAGYQIRITNSADTIGPFDWTLDTVAGLAIGIGDGNTTGSHWYVRVRQVVEVSGGINFEIIQNNMVGDPPFVIDPNGQVTVTPAAPSAPIILGVNAQEQLVSYLNSEIWDGFYMPDPTGNAGKVLVLDVGETTLSWSNAVSLDHGSLSGLGDDDHTQYLHLTSARTVSVTHTWSEAQSFTKSVAGADWTALILANSAPAAANRQVSLEFALSGYTSWKLYSFDGGSYPWFYLNYGAYTIFRTSGSTKETIFLSGDLTLSRSSSAGSVIFKTENSAPRATGNAAKINFTLSNNSQPTFSMYHYQGGTGDNETMFYFGGPGGSVAGAWLPAGTLYWYDRLFLQKSMSGSNLYLDVRNTASRANSNASELRLTLTGNTQSSYVISHQQYGLADGESLAYFLAPDGAADGYWWRGGELNWIGGDFRVQRANSAAEVFVHIDNSASRVGGNTSRLYFGLTDNSQANYSFMHYQYSSADNASYLRLMLPSGSEGLRVDRSGNMSILGKLYVGGITTPSNQLDVLGTAYIRTGATSGTQNVLFLGNYTDGVTWQHLLQTNDDGDQALVFYASRWVGRWNWLRSDPVAPVMAAYLYAVYAGDTELWLDTATTRAAGNKSSLRLSLSDNSNTAWRIAHYQNSTSNNDTKLVFFNPAGNNAIWVHNDGSVQGLGQYLSTESSQAGGYAFLQAINQATRAAGNHAGLILRLSDNSNSGFIIRHSQVDGTNNNTQTVFGHEGASNDMTFDRNGLLQIPGGFYSYGNYNIVYGSASGAYMTLAIRNTAARAVSNTSALQLALDNNTTGGGMFQFRTMQNTTTDDDIRFCIASPNGIEAFVMNNVGAITVIKDFSVSFANSAGAVNLYIRNTVSKATGNIARLDFSLSDNTNGSYYLENYQTAASDNASVLRLVDPTYSNVLMEWERGGGVNIQGSTPVFKVSGTQVVAARRTGWTDQTATASRADLGASPTVGALASFCRALYDDLKTHGLIGN